MTASVAGWWRKGLSFRVSTILLAIGVLEFPLAVVTGWLGAEAPSRFADLLDIAVLALAYTPFIVLSLASFSATLLYFSTRKRQFVVELVLAVAVLVLLSRVVEPI